MGKRRAMAPADPDSSKGQLLFRDVIRIHIVR